MRQRKDPGAPALSGPILTGGGKMTAHVHRPAPPTQGLTVHLEAHAACHTEETR